MESSNGNVSVCPAGEAFDLPADEDYEQEISRLKELVKAQRAMGREIVVVMGVGFVGAVMAGVVADSVDRETGQPGKFVIGMQRPSSRSFWMLQFVISGGYAAALMKQPGNVLQNFLPRY